MKTNRIHWSRTLNINSIDIESLSVVLKIVCAKCLIYKTNRVNQYSLTPHSNIRAKSPSHYRVSSSVRSPKLREFDFGRSMGLRGESVPQLSKQIDCEWCLAGWFCAPRSISKYIYKFTLAHIHSLDRPSKSELYIILTIILHDSRCARAIDRILFVEYVYGNDVWARMSKRVATHILKYEIFCPTNGID